MSFPGVTFGKCIVYFKLSPSIKYGKFHIYNDCKHLKNTSPPKRRLTQGVITYNIDKDIMCKTCIKRGFNDKNLTEAR